MKNIVVMTIVLCFGLQLQASCTEIITVLTCGVETARFIERNKHQHLHECTEKNLPKYTCLTSDQKPFSCLNIYSCGAAGATIAGCPCLGLGCSIVGYCFDDMHYKYAQQRSQELLKKGQQAPQLTCFGSVNMHDAC